jgi:hypothetical protein
MITKDSIETAYSFLHQKQRIYVHSTLDWQKDDIEIAIASYADEMSQVIGLPLRSSKNYLTLFLVAELTS